MNIGNNIRKLRIEADKSITEMAQSLNIANITYNHYETQEKIVPLERLIEIALYFKVSIDFIFELCDLENYSDINFDLNRKKIGERLKYFRKSNKLTQQKLASVLNTVHPTITNYENGKNLISTSFLYDICRKYNISADYLLGRIDFIPDWCNK